MISSCVKLLLSRSSTNVKTYFTAAAALVTRMLLCNGGSLQDTKRALSQGRNRMNPVEFLVENNAVSQ